MSVSVSSRPISSLEATARRLCEARGGHWSGSKGMARCPAHDDRTPSLGVTLGRNAVLFHCFAGCSQADVLAALAREGFAPRQLFGGSVAIAAPPSPRETRPSANALRLWREARPLSGSPAKAYLETRGITAASSALRFHPQTPLGPKGRVLFLPAMLAAVSLDEGPIAVHRTFLGPATAGKAGFANPKRALGALGSGAVRLFAPADGKLGLAEGVESALSARALTKVPTWATLGNERFGLVSIPESVTELHLFVDNDAGGDLAAERGLAAYAREDRRIVTRRPSKRGDDWNDALVAWQRRRSV
ncbi:MAG: toprim domain-containing protein [Altererythrobacter sp.]|nr:toprim domain-containing protein [Altererythrobacter sp.]